MFTEKEVKNIEVYQFFKHGCILFIFVIIFLHVRILCFKCSLFYSFSKICTLN